MLTAVPPLHTDDGAVHMYKGVVHENDGAGNNICSNFLFTKILKTPKFSQIFQKHLYIPNIPPKKSPFNAIKSV